jgi:hypothetical protein
VIEEVDNQIHNSQNMEGVENSTEDNSFGLSIWKPMKTKSTQQTIELQNIEDWEYWKIRPPPKHKKGFYKQQGSLLY